MSNVTPPEHDAHPGLPRWVKLSTVVIGMLLVILVLAMVLVGGEHGPGRHA